MIGRFARRMPVSLADLAQQYLAQPLPDISGIFRPRTPPKTIGPVLPVIDEPGEKGITPQLLQQTGGDNFSVYNPDPTRTRTSDQYSPFNARRFYARPGSDVGIPSGILSDSKFLYGDQVQLPGILGAGQDFIKSLLPVNRRAILENEALGAGIRLDDIGRVVSDGGNINTAENIMAGYNLAKITPETIQKRRDMINAKMKDPEQKAAKLKALDDFENKMFGTGGITDLSDGIFDQKSKIKDPTYKSTDELIKLGIKSAEDDSEDDMLEKIIEAQKTGRPIPGINTGPFPGLSFAPGMGFGVSPLGEFGTGITSIKRPDREPEPIVDVNAIEAAIAGAGGNRAAQERQRQRDQARIERAYREDTGPGPGSYGPGGGSGIQRDSSRS
jgi:hypothetical protein